MPGPSNAPLQSLSKGTRLDSFEIKGILGTGGFGITYEAWDYTLQRAVAIKEYFPTGLAIRGEDGCTLTARTEDDREGYDYGLERFLDEARTLARFNHPNIVHVTRFLQTNNTAYLVMEFETGETLGDVVKRHGALDEVRIREIMIPVLNGLQMVHKESFLHRDIKPDNIFLRSQGPPVLVDFGAARLALEKQVQTMTAMLTPGYAPIEQYSSDESQGPWTDLYAVGATMYRCLTGSKPVESTKRINALLNNSPDPHDIPLQNARSRYSWQIISVVQWLLQARARDRPRSAQAVLEALGIDLDTSTRGPNTMTDTEFAREQTILLTQQAPFAGFNSNTSAHTRPTQIAHPAGYHTQPAPAPSISDSELSQLESLLAEFMGPIAKVVVKSAAKQHPTRKALIEALAEELDDADERTAFLRKTH